jgi:peptidoglycan-N-acetylglucosamine deacetylase
MRSLRTSLMAAAFLAAAGAPFTAGSAHAGSGGAAGAADGGAIVAKPVPPEATSRLAAQNNTPVSADSTPVPLQTTTLAHAEDNAPAKARDNAPTHSQDGTQGSGSQSRAHTPDGAAATPSTPQQNSAHNQDAAPSQDASQTRDETQSAKTDDKQDGKADSGKDSAGNAPAQSSAQNSSQDGAQAGANCPGNPNALGTSRILAIDSADFRHIGRMQYPHSLPLRDKEVVITFDDGPLPPYSNEILDILAAQCVKVTYFLVGEMARSFPSVVRREYEEGHTIGTHSEDHPLHFGELPIDRMRREIDVGISDVAAALGDTKYLAPFFRIPGLDRSTTLEDELAARHLAVFSSDTVADDWRHISSEQIRSLALKRLEARGKGILLLHDIHPKTVAALPGILKDLKDNGFRIVQVVPSASYEIAMANKPETRMLASAIPGEIALPSGIDNAAAKPAWPQPAAEGLSADVASLPAPDASAFQPDSGTADDSAAVQWPEQPKVTVSSEEGHHRHVEKVSQHVRHKKHDTDSAEHEGRHHHHERERAGGDRHHADITSEIKKLAALFTPAH